MSVKLTQYSKASGCGCKIAPAVLEEILKGTDSPLFNKHLLVGNESRDDAAVYELDANNCIISTTDFFTPVVDDAFDFGKIASCNAISDVYAMGGKPIMAIAILGWPTEKIEASVAQQVIKGAQEICHKAGIPLAGGHSVDSQEPLFGLAVTGVVKKSHIKKNNTARVNDVLYLTKPIGTGIMAAALKRGLLKDADYAGLLETTTSLNTIGSVLGELNYVHAVTDVTGFGLAGHLLEMLSGNALTAVIKKSFIPVMPAARELSAQFVFPDNTTRNYNAQAPFITGMTDLDFILYCDPQTSGGLLISVDPQHEKDMDALLHQHEQFFAKIGALTEGGEHKIVFE